MPPQTTGVRLASLAALAALSSCDVSASRDTSAALPPGAIRVVDGLGREVSLPSPASRVVSLAPSTTEIVCALGACDRLVGRDSRSDYPPRVASVPEVGGFSPRPSLEAIVALRADLVVASARTSPEGIAALAKLTPAVYRAALARGLDDVYRDVRAIGRLLGRDEAAARLVGSLRDRVAAVAERSSALPSRPSVLYEVDASDPARPWTAGAESIVDELIAIAGGRSLGSPVGAAYFQMSLEDIVASDPDVILTAGADDSTEALGGVAHLRDRPGWETLSAVQAGRVHRVDDDLLARHGPRIVRGLEEIARVLAYEASR